MAGISFVLILTTELLVWLSFSDFYQIKTKNPKKQGLGSENDIFTLSVSLVAYSCLLCQAQDRIKQF